MSHCLFRVHYLIAGVLIALASAASAAEEITIPQLDTARPHALPYYPDNTRQAGRTGTVVLAVHVNEIGRPFVVQMAKSSGFPDLDQAGIDAVRRWHFEPATWYGERIADWTAVGFEFGPDGVKQIDVPPETDISRNWRGKVICKQLAPKTGSRINDAPTCMTRWEWEERARQYNVKLWKEPPRPAMGGQTGSGK
jgi:TonB family protein